MSILDIVEILKERDINPDVINSIEFPKNEKDLLIVSIVKHIFKQSIEYSKNDDIIVPHDIIDEICTSILDINRSLQRIYTSPNTKIEYKISK